MAIIKVISSALALEYDKLYKVGVRGRLTGDLGEVGALFAREDGFDVASVVRQSQRNLLAVFALQQPIVDLTVDLYDSGGSAVVAWSLDADRANSLIERVIGRVSFFPDAALDESFVRTFSEEFDIDRFVYDRCAAISRFSEGRRVVGDLFAVVRYGNFLHQYRGVPEADALRMANERYGSSLP
ncbi:MAG: hypothetical protein KKD18_06345 [Nanoarchaeota archaeon]|nr:hypothetical protein [Nanoarchaeota archaeon]MBU0978013.1 hypothetical protein [Nanoarchaeota archaeon]